MCKVLDTELKRFTSAPDSFKNSPVGADVEDNIGIAKTDAIRRTGILARKRYKRMLDELREHLRSAQKIIVDITNAQRKKIDETIATGQWSARRTPTSSVASTRTKSTSSGRSTASTGVTSWGTTARSCKSNCGAK